jgi:hypothetical protein
MAWGEWLVPEVAPECEFQLAIEAQQLRRDAHKQPEQVAELAAALAHENLRLQSIVTKATARICELEARRALAPSSTPAAARESWLTQAARELQAEQRQQEPAGWWGRWRRRG